MLLELELELELELYFYLNTVNLSDKIIIKIITIYFTSSWDFPWPGLSDSPDYHSVMGITMSL